MRNSPFSLVDLDAYESVFSGETMREVRIRNRFRRRGVARADESRARDTARHVAARGGRHHAGVGV